MVVCVFVYVIKEASFKHSVGPAAGGRPMPHMHNKN